MSIDLNNKYFTIINSFDNYVYGLNEDPYFSLDNTLCSKLYFTSFEDIFKLCSFGKYICDVTIPDDAICHTKNNYKVSNKMVIHSKILIKELELWNNPTFCLHAINQSWLTLKYIPDYNKTIEICLIAVNQDGYALEYIPNKTIEIIEVALKQNGNALYFIDETLQTNDICKIAIRQNAMALEYVINPTDDLYELALKRDGFALRVINNQTPYLCELAYNENKKSAKYIKDITSPMFKIYYTEFIDDDENKLSKPADILINDNETISDNYFTYITKLFRS